METQPRWRWPPAGDAAAQPSSTSDSARESPPPPPEQQDDSWKQKYGPRMCRICFDTEQPTFPSNISSTLGISSSKKPTYVSDDPELGRLFSPCKCSGSQKYVHEGCLNAWRKTSPSADRNFWQCPTCKYTYRMSRLRWASLLSSKLTRAVLTVVIMIMSLFILGFIADPVVNLWFDPVGTISDSVSNVVSDIEALNPRYYYDDDGPASWTEHFMKGFFSLGVVGLIKSMIAAGPWYWAQIRLGNSGRRRGTGRARAENISLVFVLIGAFTFMVAIWKAVKVLSAIILSRVSESILDIDGDTAPGDAAGKKTG